MPPVPQDRKLLAFALVNLLEPRPRARRQRARAVADLCEAMLDLVGIKLNVEWPSEALRAFEIAERRRQEQPTADAKLSESAELAVDNVISLYDGVRTMLAEREGARS